MSQVCVVVSLGGPPQVRLQRGVVKLIDSAVAQQPLHKLRHSSRRGVVPMHCQPAFTVPADAEREYLRLRVAASVIPSLLVPEDECVSGRVREGTLVFIPPGIRLK